jgi:hypothetical protein
VGDTFRISHLTAQDIPWPSCSKVVAQQQPQDLTASFLKLTLDLAVVQSASV